MGFFDKVFGKLRKNQSHRILDTIGAEIVRSSYNCSQKMKEHINFDDAIKKETAEQVIFSQYLYFFMHNTLRNAFEVMTKEQIGKLQEYLWPLIARSVVDINKRHWPEDMKKLLITNFYKGLEDSELEYSATTKLMDKDNAFAKDSALYILSKNVAQYSGNSKRDPLVITKSNMLAMNELMRVRVHVFVEEAAKVI